MGTSVSGERNGRSRRSGARRAGLRPALLCALAALGCGGDGGAGTGAAGTGAAGTGAAGMAAAGMVAAGMGAAGSSGASGGGEAGSAAGAPAAEPGPLRYAPCDDAERVGRFAVVLEARFTGINGGVWSAVQPEFVLEELASEGECRLMRGRTQFCDPMCDVGQVCAEGTCVPEPRRQNVGTVTVTGLKVSPLSMMPLQPGNTYTNPAEPRLPHPGFDEGDEITLVASGGDHDPFALRAVGVAPLEVGGAAVPVMADAPALVEWTPPGRDDLPTGMLLVLDVARHGSSGGRIECDVPDTGSFEIPAALVTQLLELGVSGFPAVNLTRRSANSIDHELGCVELAVTSEARLAIELPGVVSCNTSEQCPDGQTCTMARLCE